jgi:hypothetical protein
MKRYQENHFQMELWSGMILLLHEDPILCIKNHSDVHLSVDTSSSIESMHSEALNSTLTHSEIQLNIIFTSH